MWPQRLLDKLKAHLLSFINEYIEPASHITTDGWKGYQPVDDDIYTHHQVFQTKAVEKDSVLPGVHLVASLVKRVIRGTHQCRFEPKYLQNYFDEYVFRFNRRTSRSVGKKFMRIVQQVTHSTKLTYQDIKDNIDSISSKTFSLGLYG